MRKIRCTLIASLAFAATSAAGAPFFFSTGAPDGRMGTASRPGSAGGVEIESADDFLLTSPTAISSASFTGLLSGLGTVGDVLDVRVEIYRVFPNDSDVGRTSGPPLFSTSAVPTRVNSPSDVAFDERDSKLASLAFLGTNLGTASVANSVLNDMSPTPPALAPGGEGSVTGSEVQFDVTFATPFSLLPGHYFFVPQVLMGASSGSQFYWMSAPKPIVSPGTPFTPDLQEWIRNASLAPDWLRVGTDIVSGSPAPTFNAVFSLTGVTQPGGSSVPEPAALPLCVLALLATTLVRRRTGPSATQ